MENKMKKIIACFIFLFTLLNPFLYNGSSFYIPKAQAANYFSFDNTTKKLIISTQMLDLAIEGGAVVYLKDKKTGEVFVDTTAWGNLFDYSSNRNGTKSSFISTNAPTGNRHSERVQENSPTVFTQISTNKSSLTYSNLLSDETGNSRLIINIEVDESTGEVFFQLTGTSGDLNWQPIELYLPILNFAKNSVILGSGAKIMRSDSSIQLETNLIGYGLPSPSVGMIEGSNSALMYWSELTIGQYIQQDSVQLNHNAGYDSMVLYCLTDPKEQNKQVISSPVFRIGFYKNWLEAARYWRHRFEQRSGAKPLWQNDIAWVRKIHVMHPDFYWDWELNKYDELAALIPPENLLWFLWNGDRLVLAGDLTYSNIRLPHQNWTDIMRSKGWHILLYHHWNLYYSEQGAASHLQELKDEGRLPEGYTFNPDYVGADDPDYTSKTGDQRMQDWLSYWQNISDTYFSDPKTLRVMNPQTTEFQNYIVRNFRDWCSAYNNQCDGSYFDTMGAGDSGSRKHPIINGQDYVMGEVSAIVNLRSNLPNLGIMSETLPMQIIPYVFYTYQGSNYINQYSYTLSPVNHPLRTALIGSYTWLREESILKPEETALLGTLPQVSLVGDYLSLENRPAPDDYAIWSQSRGKLFCEAELWNDLPPNWDPDALAYYRSKYGTWFKAKKIRDNDFGYYEEIPGMGDVLRLQKSNPVIIPRPGTTYSTEDINQDGTVNTQDLQACANQILGTQSWPRADVNGDGKYDVKDLQRIANAILGV